MNANDPIEEKVAEGSIKTAVTLGGAALAGGAVTSAMASGGVLGAVFTGVADVIGGTVGGAILGGGATVATATTAAAIGSASVIAVPAVAGGWLAYKLINKIWR